jgi:disulfide oxidoreductase YuzD
MKNLFLALTILVLGCNGFSQQTNNNTVTDNQGNKILVYFFHGTHRCTGCINAEKGTVNALNALYKAQLDNGTIKFESINVEEDKNKALAEKYEAAWNKLIFVKNDKSGQLVELTQQAFAYGIDNPEEMNKIVKSTVDKMLD